jgi:tyrosinase
MIVRKSVRSLTPEWKARFVGALLELKRKGRYDEYVHWHHEVMAPTTLAWEPKDSLYRNGAHRGSSFLPWHREFLLQVEADLRAIDDTLFLPYWDWSEDAQLGDPATSPLWADDFMGGNGAEGDGWRVATGPFAHAGGNWPIPEHHGGPALLRRFGVSATSLPTEVDVGLALRELLYDTPGYDSSPFTLGFRNRLEGWITRRADPNVTTPGSQLHNRVHLWVGGSMEPMTSPNDPVFFLHHCFVDKIWADWQQLQRQARPEGAPHYAPEREGPPGHNLGDTLRPWTRTIRDALDIAQLGYSYEQTEAQRATLAKALRARPISPFVEGGRSPFEAD